MNCVHMFENKSVQFALFCIVFLLRALLFSSLQNVSTPISFFILPCDSAAEMYSFLHHENHDAAAIKEHALEMHWQSLTDYLEKCENAGAKSIMSPTTQSMVFKCLALFLNKIALCRVS